MIVWSDIMSETKPANAYLRFSKNGEETEALLASLGEVGIEIDIPAGVAAEIAISLLKGDDERTTSCLLVNAFNLKSTTNPPIKFRVYDDQE